MFSRQVEQPAGRLVKQFEAPFARQQGSFSSQSVCVAKVTPALANLLQRMLDPDPSTRITAAEAAAHPWAIFNLPPGLVGLNDRLAAAASSGSVSQGRSAAAGCCRRSAAAAGSSQTSNSGGGSETASFSHLRRLSAARQSDGELAALVARAALPDIPSAFALPPLMGGPSHYSPFGEQPPPQQPSAFSVVPRYGPEARLAA